MGPADADLAEGTLFGKYRLVRLVGKGGMGTVWEAEPAEQDHEHARGPSRLAIKVLPKEVAADSTVRARFEREGEIAARLHHPHIVDVTDVGTCDEIPFLAMEFLDGEDLGSLLDRTRPLPESQIADLLLPICAAVGAAHREGIIHRDIKPENVFLATKRVEGEVEGEGETSVVPKLLDFGISKVAAALAGSNDLTKTSSLLGTPYYMSPEQVRGAKYIDPRSDVYALGVILYECATGRRPFEDVSLYNLLLNIVSGTPPSPRGENPALSPEFEAVVLEAMAREVDARTANVFLLGKRLLPFASAKVRETWEPAFADAPSEPIEVAQKSEEPLGGSRRNTTRRVPTPSPASWSGPSSSQPAAAGDSTKTPIAPPPATTPSGRAPSARAPASSTSPSEVSAKSPARGGAVAWIVAIAARALVSAILVVRGAARDDRSQASTNVASGPRKGTLAIQAPKGAIVKVDGVARPCPDGKLALEGALDAVFEVTVLGPDGAPLATQKVHMREAGVQPATLVVPAK